MSGTSLDGIDIALARIRGSGRSMEVDVLFAGERPWPEPMRSNLLAIADPDADVRLSVAALSALDASLAEIYAEAIRSVVQQSGHTMADIDVVGNHGQTVFHDPKAGHTMQLGNPSRLANLLGVPVVGDFRQADMALGGEGAPLVPYMDWVLFTSPTEHRLLLNLGGIANITSLPPNADREQVLAFDTGPANMILDQLASRLLGAPYDRDGAVSAAGSADELVVEELLNDAWFRQPPPKSTGRERFGRTYVDRVVHLTDHLGTADRMATAAAVTTRSIVDAVRRFVPGSPDVLWVSGGGVHNRAVMQGLESGFAGMSVASLASVGYDPDAKEAVCFALLAHEAMNGIATGMPSVTGARGRAFSGKICSAGTT